MAPPGPKPKPTVLKKLAGNPGKRRLNENEPQPRGYDRPPRAPSHLSDAAKREWRRVAKLLHEIGLLTQVDRVALEMYCEVYARWVEAEQKVRKYGPVIKTRNGNLIQNPHLAIANKAIKQLRDLMAEFGMTPSSRSRIELKGAQEKKSLAELLFEQAVDGKR